jgi:acetyl esterase/lipase
MAQSAATHRTREHIMAVDDEAEYNDRARLPEHTEIFARWVRDGDGPLAIFIHGGYWRAMTKRLVVLANSTESR